MNVDGSTGEKHKGGFILEGFDGHQYAYTMKFLFLISNNEVEYEAILAGLQMAQSLKLTHLCVKSYLQVGIKQVTSTSEVKVDNMQKNI